MSSRIAKKASKSVVIVADKREPDDYCSGCVIAKDRTGILVIAPSAFLKRRKKHLQVVFTDSTVLDATVVAVHGPFCSLRTSHHYGCEKICLLEDEDVRVCPHWTFMIVPESGTSNRRVSTYATAESLQAYLIDHTVLSENSTNYFMVSCPYIEKTKGGVNRLAAAPVFTMFGKTAGIILQDCRLDSTTPGAQLKIALKATYLRELMMFLEPPESPSNKTKKRKRKCL